MDKKAYAQANRDWLEKKSREEGVQALPGGVYYKVISSGDLEGRHPFPRSIITAHYTGTTIDGRVFDNSRSGAVPLAMRLSDLIEGWGIALRHMTVGDRWEIYLPAERGYGSLSQPGIPANSTLVFDIELLGIS